MSEKKNPTTKQPPIARRVGSRPALAANARHTPSSKIPSRPRREHHAQAGSNHRILAGIDETVIQYVPHGMPLGPPSALAEGPCSPTHPRNKNSTSPHRNIPPPPNRATHSRGPSSQFPIGIRDGATARSSPTTPALPPPSPKEPETNPKETDEETDKTKQTKQNHPPSPPPPVPAAVELKDRLPR